MKKKTTILAWIQRQFKKLSKNRYKVNLNVTSHEIHDMANVQGRCRIDKMSNFMFVGKKEMKELIAGGKFNGCRWCMPNFDTDVEHAKKK